MNKRSDQDRLAGVPSPCINECALDRPGGLCRGCGRTVAEIAAWSRSSNREKLDILAAVASRRQRECAVQPAGVASRS